MGSLTNKYFKDDVQNALLHFFDAVADFAPGWFASKFKIHLLAHVVSSITRFGIPKVYHEEPFESFNTLLRNGVIFGNHHANSRDVGLRMERQHHIRHLVSGGAYPKSSATQSHPSQWVTAAPAVINFMKSCKVLSRVYGLRDVDDHENGVLLFYLGCLWPLIRVN